MPSSIHGQPSAAQARPRRARPFRVPVVDPSVRLWSSQTAAAFGHGLMPCTVNLQARARRGGWRLATPEEVATLEPAG